jgi:Protein of unknown function (DUF933)
MDGQAGGRTDRWRQADSSVKGLVKTAAVKLPMSSSACVCVCVCVHQAAGAIHSDFERGFICAEVMHYDELHELGSEAAVRAAGKYRQEGKNYVVQVRAAERHGGVSLGYEDEWC